MTVLGRDTNTGDGGVLISYRRPIPTRTRIAASTHAASVGDRVTLTATVTATTGRPGPGTVTFLSGSTVLARVRTTTGTARLTLTLRSAGTLHVTARYTPAAAPYLASASGPATVAVTLPQTLANTGANYLPGQLGAGGAAVGLGVVLLVFARRRRVMS